MSDETILEDDDDVVIEAEFSLSISNTDHRLLTNRDAENQHPISAITDLQDELDAKATEEGLAEEITAREDADTVLQGEIDGKQDLLTSANAGTGISITGSGSNVVISNTQPSTEWGNIPGNIDNQTDLKDKLDSKQDLLVSGTNIKTINNQSLLGSGNISIQGAGGDVDGGRADSVYLASQIVDGGHAKDEGEE